MTRRRQIALVAGAGAVVLAGLGAAGAIAAGGHLSPREEAQAVIDDAAAQLGVEPSELSDALRQAYENRIDEALDEGRLTDEQAERLKERLGSAGAPLLFGPDGLRGHQLGPHGHPRGSKILVEAARFLGMTDEALREALRGSTLAELAEERGKTVDELVAALVAIQAQRIDEAVDAGKLDEEQAAELKQRLGERTEALVKGELPRPAFAGHPFRHGSGPPRGPPASSGPRA